MNILPAQRALTFSDRTLADLRFAEIREALASRCHTARGAERARARPFLTTDEEIRLSLARVEDASKLRREPTFLAVGPEPDLRASVAKAGKGGLLAPSELRDVARALDGCARSRETLEARAELVPNLLPLARSLPRLSSLARAIEEAFDPSGLLADDASPELKEARDRVRGLQRTMKSRLDLLLHDAGFLVSLREPYYSIRNERYVVPVLASERAQVPGIVHNASQSGQTLFVEPQVLIGLGNDLAIAQSLVEEEERRILQMLTDEIGQREEEIAIGLEVLAQLDELEAAAQLAADLDAAPPELVPPEEAFVLRRLRHPLLILQGSSVVANDLELPGAKALVISGPNAGGKTVTLSAVGLAALMVRAGLPIAADAGSRMPLYRSVHSAIGDAQDLSRGLSTFSAHVGELGAILNETSRAPTRGSGALVLIDEIAADTDPREGSAIAIALLEELLERGAAVLVTTHLEELKALAHVDPRFQNARVGFDSRSMAPTYRLQLGASGGSSAIEVVRRLGLPDELCQRAQELASGKSGTLTRALSAAEAAGAKLEERLAELDATAAALTREREALSRERDALEARRRDQELNFRRALEAELRGARAQIDQLLGALRERTRAETREEAQRALRDARSQVADRLEEQERATRELSARIERDNRPDTPLDLRVGGRAHHTGLRAEVEILEVEGDFARVAAGPLKTRVPISELAPPRTVKAPRSEQLPGALSGRKARALRNAQASAGGSLPSSGRRCDLRGMRADEALAEVDRFLDQALAQGLDEALLVHGHGTGALKQVVRDYLARSPYLEGFRPGQGPEGGDGVTVVTLRGP